MKLPLLLFGMWIWAVQGGQRLKAFDCSTPKNMVRYSAKEVEDCSSIKYRTPTEEALTGTVITRVDEASVSFRVCQVDSLLSVRHCGKAYHYSNIIVSTTPFKSIMTPSECRTAWKDHTVSFEGGGYRTVVRVKAPGINRGRAALVGGVQGQIGYCKDQLGDFYMDDIHCYGRCTAEFSYNIRLRSVKGLVNYRHKFVETENVRFPASKQEGQDDILGTVLWNYPPADCHDFNVMTVYQGPITLVTLENRHIVRLESEGRQIALETKAREDVCGFPANTTVVDGIWVTSGIWGMKRSRKMPKMDTLYQAQLAFLYYHFEIQARKTHLIWTYWL